MYHAAVVPNHYVAYAPVLPVDPVAAAGLGAEQRGLSGVAFERAVAVPDVIPLVVQKERAAHRGRH